MTFAPKIQQAFEHLRLDNLGELMRLYALDARFKDPFNEVSGVDGIERIFRHMFSQVKSPRFTVSRVIESETDIFIRWDFEFVSAGKSGSIHGATHFEINVQGLITLHRDYWDPAEELYESIPLLGWLFKQLRKKLSAH